jgi:DNA-binding NarL/FixJ family response regulator
VKPEMHGMGYAMAKKIKPDVALVDISLPDESGMQLTRRIREALPNTRVMIVSMHSKIDYIVEAFQAGATGYVVKESAAGRLVQGLHVVTEWRVFSGQLHLSRSGVTLDEITGSRGAGQ